MKAAGFEGWGTHVFTPYLGFEPDWPYDYVQMNHWYTFEHRGKTQIAGALFLRHIQVAEESGWRAASAIAALQVMMFNNVDKDRAHKRRAVRDGPLVGLQCINMSFLDLNIL